MSVVIHTVGPLPQSAPVAPLPLWRFSVEQYHAMIRKGIFSPEDRVALVLDGCESGRIRVGDLLP